MKTQPLTIPQKIDQFATLIQGGIDAWTQAGELIVVMLDEDPTVIDRICDKHQWLTPEIIVRFEQIGRKQVNPKLLLSDAAGIRALRRMPFSVQEKYAESPVELLIMEGGKTDMMLVNARNLTPSQASQVFAKDHVRDRAEQRAFIADKNQSATFPNLSSTLPYKIKSGAVQFTGNCTLTAHELAEILAQIR